MHNENDQLWNLRTRARLAENARFYSFLKFYFRRSLRYQEDGLRFGELARQNIQQQPHTLRNRFKEPDFKWGQDLQIDLAFHITRILPEW